MGSKVRCPGCGAKNDSSSHRCRICTNVINAEAVARNEEVPAPSATSVLDDHFDADEINRQIQPARSRFGGETGGLAARIAAAGGAQPTMPAAAPGPGPAPAPLPAPAWSGPESVEIPTSASAPISGAPPIEFEAEPFDPDALFRDAD